MFCRTCGKEILDETVICPYCGCLTGVRPPTGQLNYEQNAYPTSAHNNPDMTDRNENPISFEQNGTPNTTQTFPQNTSAESDKVKTSLVVLSVLLPPAGFILGIIHKDVGKVKLGKTYTKIAAITMILIILNLLFVCIVDKL